MNDTHLLSEVGKALYGDHWQAALASQIAVSERSMRRWANGTDPIPWGVWRDVFLLLETRATNLNYWKSELYERVVIKECQPRPVEKFDAEQDWAIEVHAPFDGRHSMKHHAFVRSLADVKALMRQHPGMKFLITPPLKILPAERHEFEQMGLVRV